jgi:acylphosphatase
MAIKRISIAVSGKVQGVFYRVSTEKKANEIGLTGFVRNEPDGKVYIEAQGTEEQLDEFVKWCKRGPERAKVDEITTRTIPLVEESLFRIIR